MSLLFIKLVWGKNKAYGKFSVIWNTVLWFVIFGDAIMFCSHMPINLDLDTFTVHKRNLVFGIEFCKLKAILMQSYHWKSETNGREKWREGGKRGGERENSLDIAWFWGLPRCICDCSLMIYVMDGSIDYYFIREPRCHHVATVNMGMLWTRYRL